MKPRCPRCERAPLMPNEDGDPSCFVCGYVALDVPAWVAEQDPNDQARRRRPSTQGVAL